MESAASRVGRGKDPIRHHVRRTLRQSLMVNRPGAREFLTVPGAVGVGEGRAPRRDGARVIEPALMARHRRLDLPQRRSPAQLRKQKRAQVLARGETARPLVAPMLRNQPVEGRPRDEFQKA